MKNTTPRASPGASLRASRGRAIAGASAVAAAAVSSAAAAAAQVVTRRTPPPEPTARRGALRA
jgi:hypothetical protein